MELRQDAVPLPAITFLTQDEVRRLFGVITGKRDRALFQLAYHHGLRASEVSLLQRDDIHEKQGRIYIPRVKGSIAKIYPLQPEDLRLVRAYLRTREDDSPYLFITSRGIPLERRSYWDLMQKYGQGADIPKSKRRFHALRSVSPHCTSFVDRRDPLSISSLLWANRRNSAVVATSDLG
jgi:integrase/recombinase XerD